ncbi:MAG: hypothetical protein Q7R87_00925 [Nanoarchaeota archaeon]|nr:hypothetical protein [Nanoarchaeota archaeon]
MREYPGSFADALFDIEDRMNSPSRPSRGYSGRMCIDTLLGMEAQEKAHDLEVFKTKVTGNKTLLDYVARSAVGTGNAGAYVVEAPFKVGAFLLRGAYRLAEGAGKLAVGLAPHGVNALIAYLNRPVQSTPPVNPVTPPPIPTPTPTPTPNPDPNPPVTPEASRPQPEPRNPPVDYDPRGEQQGPQFGRQPGEENTYSQAFPYMQGMNRFNSPNISATTNPTNTTSPVYTLSDFGKTSAKNIGNTSNTFKQSDMGNLSDYGNIRFENVGSPVITNTVAPVIHIYLDSKRVASTLKDVDPKDAGTTIIKETPKAKDKSKVDPKQTRRKAADIYALKGEGRTIKIPRQEYLLFKEHHDKKASNLEKML